MQFQRFRNIAKGYVRIYIEGFYIEKVINICKKNNIELSNVTRNKNTLIYGDVSVVNFRALAKIAKKNKCKVKIIRKSGIPFVVRRYRKRKIFAVTMVLICVCMFSLSKFVWNIEVVGLNNVAKDEILNIVKNEGLEIGKLKSKINLSKIVEQIRMERSDISWVGIKLSGTNVKIEIVESDIAPNLIDENDYCNIVASKDAMIEKISAQNGTALVKKGDVVKKGEVLIAGWIEGKYTGTRYVHSNGNVIGKVWYTEKARAYYSQNCKIRTGEEESKYSVKLNKFEINFFKSLSKFEIYDTIKTEKKLRLFSNFYLPFEFVKITNYEEREEKIEYTADEAKEQATKQAKKQIELKMADNEGIINEYINTDEKEEYVDVEVTYEVLESIGTEEKIAL